LKDGLLGGLMVSATGTFEPGHPWRGNPKFLIKFDPNAARKLMSEAGYSKDKRLKVKTQTSTSGSGQMLPLPMNEFIQQSLGMGSAPKSRRRISQGARGVTCSRFNRPASTILWIVW
jgi:ABC-type transport system substrate-binding protein